MASNTFQSEYYNSASTVAPTPSGNSGSYQYLESKQLPAIFIPPGLANLPQPGQANQNLLLLLQLLLLIPLGASSTPGNYNSQYSSSYAPSNDYSYGYYYNNNSSDSTSSAPLAASGAAAANSNTQRILPLGYYPSSTNSALATNKAGSYTSSNTPPQIYPQSSNFPSSLACHQYHPNYITTSSNGASGATQSLPPPGVASYQQQQQQARQSISSSSTQSPSQKQAFPVSPQSIGLDSNNVNDSYLSSSYHNSHNSPIDYSSLVSYTISPTLKRKRNKAKSLSDASGTSSMDSKLKVATFSCQVCHKVFQKQYNLKSHMKIHFSEKPFQCSKCPKRFARSHDKKRHELLHDGVKNFKCEGYLKDGVTKWGCGKKFVRSDALSRHFRTETGWLCIRPLMEESKRLENKNMNHENHPPQANSQFPQVHLSHIHQHQHQLQQLDSGIGQESQDHGLGQINAESDAAGEVGIASTNPDGSYIYNSPLIRGMIQSK